MRFARPVSRSAVAAGGAALAVAVAGGIVIAATHGSGSGDQKVGAGSQHLPPASLALHERHGRLAYAEPIRFSVRNGVLTAVNLHEPNGTAVAGTYNVRHTEWRSQTALGPTLSLTGQVSYADLAHHSTTVPISTRTADAPHQLEALLSPGGGDTVGVGSPVVVTFNYPIPNSLRATIERRLSVTTSPSVVGAWHWMSDQEVHWRPPAYWKTGTKVTIASDLQGIHVGKKIWALPERHQTSFKVGPSHISIANVATDQMSVYDNGKLIRTLPFSGGRSQYPTKNGVHIAIEKSPSVIMDSATVGIPKGSPGYYYETVYWDVRISDGGAFVHAAPWSVADQGHTNVSHGCINLSPANAEWFYNWALRGDIVDVINSAAAVDRSDPGMADWNYSWKQWLKGDAAPTAAAKHLHPKLLPEQHEPGMHPVVHHKKHKHHG